MMVAWVHMMLRFELMVRILDKLVGCDKYQIKLSHKEILVGILLKCGVVESQLNTVCSTIDKLDKIDWSEAEIEFSQKGLTAEMITSLQKYLTSTFTVDTLKELVDIQVISNTVCDSMTNLMSILTLLGINTSFTLDITLARGMDYYTGIIFEAVYLDSETMGSSIAAGGRYDKMIGKLSNKGNIPAIGLSIGVERIATIKEREAPKEVVPPKVYVATVGGGSTVFQHKIKICSQLRALGINCTMSDKLKPKMASQLEMVFEKKIPYMFVIGENEINAGTVNVKTIADNVQVTMTMVDAIEFIKSK